jgi:hypothetical protein
MTILPSIANSLRKKIQQMAVHVSPSSIKTGQHPIPRPTTAAGSGVSPAARLSIVSSFEQPRHKE